MMRLLLTSLLLSLTACQVRSEEEKIRASRKLQAAHEKYDFTSIVKVNHGYVGAYSFRYENDEVICYSFSNSGAQCKWKELSQ
jgi:hypothetical protein